METRNKINLATARVVPVVLACIVAYISYVVTGPLTIEYLLNPTHPSPVRLVAGLTVIILYYLFLIPVGATYLRILAVVWTDPGYVPLGSLPKSADGELAPGLEEFWMRDVFVCDSRGLPIWCPFCNTWKPDRTHHSQDAGRCTRKMDHFCPWVGGVIGERSYKFFVQFNFYSCILSVFTTTVLAYFVAEQGEGSARKLQWSIALGFSAFFCVFTLGIFLNSLWMTLRSVTSIENVNALSGTLLLAVLLPPGLQEEHAGGPSPPRATHLSNEAPPPQSADSERPWASDINDASHSTYFSNLHVSRPPRRSAVLPHQNQIWKGTVTYPLHLQTDRPPLPAPSPRTFAILETLPGMNPWHLGSQFRNFEAIFGRSLLDWLLPIKHSPCCDHSSPISEFPLGPDFEELIEEAGLAVRPRSAAPAPDHDPDWSTVSRKRKRKARLDPGWQHGERPDGWLSEKEARRLRNEARRNVREAVA